MSYSSPGAQCPGGIPVTMNEGSSPEEREGTQTLPCIPTDRETLSEPGMCVCVCIESVL